MTTTPKPTPPRRLPTALTTPPPPGAHVPVPDTMGHLDAALLMLAMADQYAADAVTARLADDHQMAGQYRERERACMKRADLLVEISKAEALDHIAQRLDRIALSQ